MMTSIPAKETRSLSGLEESFSSHRASFQSINRAWIRTIARHSQSLTEKPRMGLSAAHVERIASLGMAEIERIVTLDFPLVAHRSRDLREWDGTSDHERADWRNLATACFVSVGNIIRSHGNSSRLILGATCACESALGANPLTGLDDGDAAECRLYSRLSPTALTYLLEGVDGSEELWKSAKRQAHAAVQTPFKCDCARKN